MNRRIFCKNSFYTAALASINTLPLSALAYKDELVHLTILHTNDVHSRIDPFPMDGSRNAGQGGAARRAAIIKDLRSQIQNVLLFDSGDIFQGTPYFNVFGGELEMKLMSQMGYDAVTMGNHDFDAGVNGFDKQLPNAKFPVIVSNYDFKNTELDGKVIKYKIWNIDGVKIGIYGLGIELYGLVPQSLYGETQYKDPISVANIQEDYLKNELKCDYIVCLSHLGYKYRNDTVSDIVLANNTFHTDLILGGHTHTFMDQPDVQKNLNGQATFINQAGWAGILLGRVDLVFEKGKKRRMMKSKNILIGEHQ